MKHFRLNIPALILFILTLSPVARAEVWWRWSFGNEEGFFLTDGSLSDAASPHTFIILDFALTRSEFGVRPGTLSGRQFFMSQSGQGFKWSGTGATEFFRVNGTYTNGSSIGLGDRDWLYSFQPNEGAGAMDSRLREGGGIQSYSSGPVSLSLVHSPVEARPDARVGKRRNPASHKGNDYYNSSGAGQKLRVPVVDRKKTVFYFSADTDADVPEALTLRGNKSRRYFKVKYHVRKRGVWTNQTGGITGAGLPLGRLVPNSPTLVRVRIKPNTRGKRKAKTLRFETRSNRDPLLTDLVKAKIVSRR